MKKTIIALLCICIALSACLKDKATAPEDPSKLPGTVHIEFDNRAGDKDFLLFGGSKGTYQNTVGDTLSFESFKYYISKIELIKEDSSSYSLGNKAYLIDELEVASHDLDFEEIPSGNYIGIRFLLGLDSVTCVNLPDTGIFAPAKGMRYPDPSEPIFCKTIGKFNGGKDFQYWTGGWKNSDSKGAVNISLYKTAAQTFAVAKNRECEVHVFVDALQQFNSPHPFDLDNTPSITEIGTTSGTLADNCKYLFKINHIHNDPE